MREFKYVVQDELGIHARPAGVLVKVAKEFEASIKMRKDDKDADCKKIFAVMGLCVKCGETIQIVVDGKDENECFVPSKK